MRIFALSDIHIDYKANLAWLQGLSKVDYVDDILILAGDVTDNLELLEAALTLLAQMFRKVCFVPGNHELWVRKGDFECSLEKFNAIRDLCSGLDIVCDNHCEDDITLVPLLSWYDYSFAEPDRSLKRRWRDYRSCKWPAYLDSSLQINEHFLAMNVPSLETTNKVLISYSHFVPRIDLMPSRIPLEKRNVYPVLGSESLGKQVLALKPDVHVYGHSHVNRAKSLDGIHYVNNAFGYPSESLIARKELHCIYADGRVQTGSASAENS